MKKVASYCEEQVLLNLAKVNFIYGENGSGKSTIAKYINDCDNLDYAKCELEWDAQGAVDSLVYDREFVDNTLRETKVSGVFTFGDGAGTKQDHLEEAVSKRNKYHEELLKLQKTIDGKSEELHKEQERFKEDCWKLQKKYKVGFLPALKGFGVKNKFREQCVKFIDRLPRLSKEELVANSKIFFSDQPERLPDIPVLNVNNVEKFELNPIFKKRIVGKEDVPIAGIIKILGNSDWVRKGMDYYDGRLCPFCQQLTHESFEEDLANYFDDSYSEQMDELEKAIDSYGAHVERILSNFEGLKKQESDRFSFAIIESHIEIAKAKFEKNKAALDAKKREPSTVVELDSLTHDLESILGIVTDARNRVIDFNLRIDNFAQEQKTLVSEVWAHIGFECKEAYESHKKRILPLNKAICAIQDKQKDMRQDSDHIENEIRSLERELVSISPSKDVINEILISFGFTNFHIVEDNEPGYYRIEREDGSIAKDSLSEGERTFITFLYFYQLIRGSVSKEGGTRPKIVVFDDPVSSLDSKTLFVVSTLIRSLYCSELLESLNIKQIVIMTHNLYFHKEITFIEGLKNITNTPLKKGDFDFWVVRKRNGESVVTHYDENPIKTNYQLLWQEVKRCDNSPQVSPTICNTLRRILENYFGILGGINIASLPDFFEGNEKMICKSMTSWVHDGSHCIFDGIEIGTGQEYTEHYLPVFKKIFEKTKQIEHYEMMMA